MTTPSLAEGAGMVDDLQEHYSIMSVETDGYCAVSYSAQINGWACSAPSNSYLLLNTAMGEVMG